MNPALSQQGTELMLCLVSMLSLLAGAERWLVFRECCAQPGSRQDAACLAQWEMKRIQALLSA